MASNPFDQFDQFDRQQSVAPAPAGNPFDQFDQKDAAPSNPGNDIEYRGTILPLARTKNGKTNLAWPQVALDIGEAIKAPGDAYMGKIAPEDMNRRAMGVAGLVAGSGFGSKVLPAKPGVTVTGKAADTLGYDLRKAKTPEAIARAVTTGTEQVPQKLGSNVVAPVATATPPGKLSDTASGFFNAFSKNKNQENNLWEESKIRGATIAHDIDPDNLTAIQQKALELDKAAREVGAPEQVKADAAFLKQVLNQMGKPFQVSDKVKNIEKQVGAVQKVTARDRQYPPVNAKTIEKAQPTTATSGLSTSSRSQTPVTTSISQSDKLRQVNRSPYTIQQRVITRAQNTPPRTTYVSDLVKARTFANGERNKVSKDVFDMVNGSEGLIPKELQAAAKANPDFGKTYNAAYAKTKSNASIYRDEAIANKYGLDEDSLAALRSTGVKTPNQTATMRLNTIADNLPDEPKKLGSELAFLKRASGDNIGAYAQVLKAKVENVAKDIRGNYDKAKASRPTLELLFKEAGTPEAQYKPLLDALEVNTRDLASRRLSPTPVEVPSSKASRALDAILNTISLSLYGLVKSAAHSLGKIGRSAIEEQTPNSTLKTYKKSLYKSPTYNRVQELKGPAAGAAVGATLGTSSSPKDSSPTIPRRRDQ